MAFQRNGRSRNGRTAGASGAGRRSLIAAVGAATAALILAACAAGPAAPAGAGENNDRDVVLRWGVSSSFANWDPIQTGSTASTRFLTPIYESLLSLDEEGNIAPGLAESYEYNDAGDAVTFHIRQGATFHDGTPVDAAAVKAFIDRAKEQEGSHLAGDYDSIDHVTVEDEHTVTVHLKQVDHQIPYLLNVRGALITSPTAAEDPETLNVSNPVGAGPFKVVELVPESRVVLEKFEDYWDADNIHIDRIEIELGIDQSTLVTALQTGVYDFAIINAPFVQQAQDAGLDVWFGDEYAWFVQFINLNVNKEPFDDPAVVEAFKHAIDREELVEKITYGYGDVTHQPFPRGYIAFDEESESIWPYDPERSRQILADAGYAPGEVKATLVISNDNPAAVIIQQQLAEVGIDIEIEIDTNWRVKYYGKELALSLFQYFGRDSHVQALTAHYDFNGVLNLSAPYVHEDFTEALRIVRETPIDAPEYAERLREATRAGVETSSKIPYLTQPSYYAKSPKVSDPPKIQGQLSWKGVTVEE